MKVFICSYFLKFCISLFISSSFCSAQSCSETLLFSFFKEWDLVLLSLSSHNLLSLIYTLTFYYLLPLCFLKCTLSWSFSTSCLKTLACFFLKSFCFYNDFYKSYHSVEIKYISTYILVNASLAVYHKYWHIIFPCHSIVCIF